MTTVIEKKSRYTKRLIELLSEGIFEYGLEWTQAICDIYLKDLLIGKGGSHYWFKLKSNIDERIAITYLQ